MTLPGLLGAVDRLGRRALGAAVDDARSSTADQVRQRQQLESPPASGDAGSPEGPQDVR